MEQIQKEELEYAWSDYKKLFKNIQIETVVYTDNAELCGYLKGICGKISKKNSCFPYAGAKPRAIYARFAGSTAGIENMNSQKSRTGFGRNWSLCCSSIKANT